MGCFEKPFQLRVRGELVDVLPTASDDAGDGTWTCEVAGTRRYFDLPDGMLDWVEEGEWVVCSFGSFELWARRSEGRVEYRGRVELDGREVFSEASWDEEQALWSLANALPAVSVPRACFFCRWSEVEKSAGWGHLSCNVEQAAAYEHHLEHGDRRWPFLTNQWVDEWHGCPKWQLRPLGFGYRAGGHRDG
jgi:hypothetical protein